VIREDERRERLRGENLGDERRASEAVRPRRHVEVDLVELAKRPPACDRCALAVRLALGLVRNLILRTEQIDDLVVLVGLDRLDEGDDVGLELAEAVDQDCASSFPVAADPPEVLRDDPHQSDVSAATTSRSRVGVTRTATTTPTRAATAAIANATS
jgi:hypothetical protein